MSTANYENVQPLVTEEEVRGHRLHVTFRCPVTQNEANSWATIGASVTPAVVPGSGWAGAKAALTRLVGRLTGQSASTAQIGEPAAVSSSPEDLHAACVMAFERVRSQFAWDPHPGRWVWAGLLDDMQIEFNRMMERIRITEPVDKNVLSRMLAEVAMADGQIAEEEKAFFESFAAGSTTIKGAMDRGELTVDELTETTPYLREPMLTLAWALAYTDQDLDDAERRQLAHFGTGFGIAPARVETLRGWAREYVVNEVIEEAYAHGIPTPARRAEIVQVASKLGMTMDSVDDLEARARRRKGLI